MKNDKVEGKGVLRKYGPNINSTGPVLVCLV